KIHLNAAGELLFCGEAVPIAHLRELTQTRIANKAQRSDWPERGNKTVAMLMNDRGTRFADYIQVYDALKGAYHDLWDAEAQAYGRRYDELNQDQQRAIRKIYPMVIAEAEPTDHGE
ncbi:MAG: biopolymer transporter ExbD, partial [Bacteroidetes bacterium]